MSGVRGQRSPIRGYIYVLRPTILIDGKEVCKIGMTRRSVAQRTREPTTGSFVPLEIAYSLEVEDARGFERDLHARFRGRRMLGGGKEFFAVPAREVISTIERIATEVSRKRAQEAAGAEMQTFQIAIGANRMETLIFSTTVVSFLLSAFSLIIGARRMLDALTLGGLRVWAMAGVILASLIASGFLAVMVQQFLTARLFEPRFGSRIQTKVAELRAKYPLAYR